MRSKLAAAFDQQNFAAAKIILRDPKATEFQRGWARMFLRRYYGQQKHRTSQQGGDRGSKNFSKNS